MSATVQPLSRSLCATVPARPLRLVALRTTTSTSPTRSAGGDLVFVDGGLDVVVFAGLTGALEGVVLVAVVVAAGAVEDSRVVALAGVAVSGLSPRHT